MNFEELLEKLEMDVPVTMQRFGGMEKILEKFLLKFPDDESYNRVLAAKEADSREDLIRSIHTLKGLSANLGLDKLSSLCAKCLNDVRNGQMLMFEKRFPKLQREYQRVKTHITNYIKNGEK